jgi:hypothetical protein
LLDNEAKVRYEVMNSVPESARDLELLSTSGHRRRHRLYVRGWNVFAGMRFDQLRKLDAWAMTLKSNLADWARVLRYYRVGSEQGDAFNHGLCNQHSVKGIFMNRREAFNFYRVLAANG